MSDENKFDANKFSDDLRDKIHRDIHDGVKAGAENQAKRRGPLVMGVHVGTSKARAGLFWGAFMILGGVVLLLDHMGLIAIERLWRFWPLLMVCAGIANCISRERRIWGIFLVAAGALFQLNELGIAHFHWGDIWPLLLIASGLMVMWGSFEARRIGSTAECADPQNSLNELAVFGGIEKRMTSQNFQGGNVTAIFGGIELDLRLAAMEAEQAVMEVNTVFGGCEIRVPESWNVVSHGQGFFGGYSDSTRPSSTEDLTNSKRKILIVKGATIFGGVEFKN
jgi:predicted membrane protein